MIRFLCLCTLYLTTVWNVLRAQEPSLLWKISGKELQAPSYLFGTIHQICEEDYFWTDTMQSYFHRSAQLCLELDLSDPLMAAKIAQSIRSTNGKSLKDYFTPKEYERLSSYLNAHADMETEMYNQLKPIWLIMLLSNGEVGCDETTAYELHLMDSARTYDKPVVGLETVEEQINALDDIPEDKVKSYILEIVDGRTAQNTDLFQRMVACYRRQDIAELYQIIEGEEQRMISMDKLLDNRNKRWIDRIGRIAAAQSTFFAVGAGHLAGPGGLIELLRKEGYTVQPLR